MTNTDPTDGGGGRHSPNNGRAFDIPTMSYLPNGKIDDGPLATDRPHTATAQAFYRLKWFGMETTLGATQAMFEGTPVSTCLPVVGTSSACQWAEGRGNFVKFTRDAATGNFVSAGVVKNARSDAYFQTDFNLSHQIKVSKTNEARRLVFEASIFNLFNQRSAVGYYQFAIPTNLIIPSRTRAFPTDPGTDWLKVMSGYNYVDALNATGAFAGTVPNTCTVSPSCPTGTTQTKIQAPLTLASRYGLPQVFQGARNMRLAIRFTF